MSMFTPSSRRLVRDSVPTRRCSIARETSELTLLAYRLLQASDVAVVVQIENDLASVERQVERLARLASPSHTRDGLAFQCVRVRHFQGHDAARIMRPGESERFPGSLSWLG